MTEDLKVETENNNHLEPRELVLQILRNMGLLLVKILIGMELLFILLYLMNIPYEGLIDPILYHQQVYHNFLSTNTIRSTIIIAIPIMITAVGAAFNERVGVINIALEGIMLMCAWVTVYVTLETGDPIYAVFWAVVIGAFMGLMFAFFTITLKAEQIVTGVAVNLLALGLVKLLSNLVWSQEYSPTISSGSTLERFSFFDIPVLGFVIEKMSITQYGNPNDKNSFLYYFPDVISAINNHNVLIYFIVIIIPLAHVLLFKTNIGLRMRVIGEHPQAAATAGIPVIRYQYLAVIISSIFAALGGAVLAMDARAFKDEMVGGRGFIALAAMIFGKWTIWGGVGAALFFGYFVKLGVTAGISIRNFSVPTPFFQMIPYIASILVLSGFIGRATPPKHLGQPYDPSEST